MTTLGRRAVTLPAEYKDVDMTKLDTKIVGASILLLLFIIIAVGRL